MSERQPHRHSLAQFLENFLSVLGSREVLNLKEEKITSGCKENYRKKRDENTQWRTIILAPPMKIRQNWQLVIRCSQLGPVATIAEHS